MTVNVEGFVEPGFEGVRQAFIENFETHGEIGAAYALHVEGRKVVDIWGGTTTPGGTKPYGENTLQLVFSTTKGATAACANLLAQRGELDVDATVATYWPEFAQEGKKRIPVRWLLCHKAGLPTIDRSLPLGEALAWKPVIDALEHQRPLWEPGTAHGYHALTYGWLVGEVIRRIDGRSLGTFFREEIAEPLGLEFWIGLPADQEDRVAPLLPNPLLDAANPEIRALLDQYIGPQTLIGQALSLNGTFDLPDAVNTWNLPEVHAAEIGAANAVTNARSLSRFYAGLIGTVEGGPGGPILSHEQIQRARQTQTEGTDRVLSVEPYFSVDSTFGLGFMTSSEFAPFGGEGSFGHNGAGGSVGFADPEHGLAAGYVMNLMMENLSGDPRTRTLIKASYDAIGARAAYV